MQDDSAGEEVVDVHVRRPIIFALIGSYLPGFRGGGSVRTLVNLIDALGTEFGFRVVTADRDLNSPSPYPGIARDTWVRVGLADVFYLSSGWTSPLRLARLLRRTPHDVLYLNSFFCRRFSILPVLLRRLRLLPSRPVILLPSGEFSPGALGIKTVRKRLYILASRILRIYSRSDIIFRAATELEVDDIKQVFAVGNVDRLTPLRAVGARAPRKPRRSGKVTIVTARDLAGSRSPALPRSYDKRAGMLRAVFVSRISRKKNLAAAIEGFAGIEGQVFFDVFGPIEDPAYWAECQSIVARLPSSIELRYCGELQHKDVAGIFAAYDLFVFPTLGENYGHVIAEALTAGCPVLTSNRTPWTQLEAAGAGWAVPLEDPRRLAAALQACVDMGSDEHRHLSQRAAGFGRLVVNDTAGAEQHRVMFRRAMEGACARIGEQPSGSGT